MGYSDKYKPLAALKPTGRQRWRGHYTYAALAKGENRGLAARLAVPFLKTLGLEKTLAEFSRMFFMKFSVQLVDLRFGLAEGLLANRRDPVNSSLPSPNILEN
jgi:hypothetical protein